MSRRIEDLREDVQRIAVQLQARMTSKHVPVLIYSTHRSLEEQARLYRQGRALATIREKAHELRTQWGRPDLADLLMEVGPQHGAVRTNAGPGQSLHNYGVAFDAAPMRNGDIVWGTDDPADRRLWSLYGHTGQALGLEWGGAWTSFPDRPHMQLAGAEWREMIRDGAD